MESKSLKKIWKPFRSTIVIDPKRDYVNMPSELGPHWKLYGGDNLFIGSNPPGKSTKPTHWINQYAKVICAESGLSFSESCLIRTMHYLLPLLNSEREDYYYWPSLHNINELLDTFSDTTFSRKAQYTQSLQNQIDLLISESGDMFNVMRGFDILELIKKGESAVIDTSSYNDIVANIIVNIIASQILYLILTYRLVTNTTVITLIVDESDSHISDEGGKKYPEGYSPLGQLVKQGRAFGVAVCLASSFLGR